MIKTILVFEDGSEVSAGILSKNATRRTNLFETSNDGEDLRFGSVCSKMLSVDIITPKNELVISAGNEILVYEEENGVRSKKGVFIAEKPKKKNSNSTNVVAFDKISLFDKDITVWFNDLDIFPCTVYNLAKKVCEYCGVEIANNSLDNGEIYLQKTTFKSVTARQIIRWIGEICGCFCVADENGRALFKWYEENETPIVSSGGDNEAVYLNGGLSFEDYSVEKVTRVQIRQGADDIGVSYPSEENNENTYIIDSNPFLVFLSTETVISVASSIYQKIKDVEYTPCTVKLPVSNLFQIGQIINITDKNGEKITAYVMEKSRDGITETLRCVGNKKRNSAVVLYDNGYSSNYKKNESNVGKNEKDFVVEMLNASAKKIILKSNRLVIESDNFSLSEDGAIIANDAKLHGYFTSDGKYGDVEIGDGEIKIKTTSPTPNEFVLDGYSISSVAEDGSSFAINPNGFNFVRANLHVSFDIDEEKFSIYAYENNDPLAHIYLNEYGVQIDGAFFAKPSTSESGYSPVVTIDDLANLGLL
jgi:hypothetical protein